MAAVHERRQRGRQQRAQQPPNRRGVAGGPAGDQHAPVGRVLRERRQRVHDRVRHLLLRGRLVFHGRAPSTPQTYLPSDTTMGRGQLRYWSMCSNMSTTQYLACVKDDDVVLDSRGYYTIVISTAANRPTTAKPGCGIEWLPKGPLPSAPIILRNMLPDPKFKQAIQDMPAQGQRAGDARALLPTRLLLRPRRQLRRVREGQWGMRGVRVATQAARELPSGRATRTRLTGTMKVACATKARRRAGKLSARNRRARWLVGADRAPPEQAEPAAAGTGLSPSPVRPLCAARAVAAVRVRLPRNRWRRPALGRRRSRAAGRLGRAPDAAYPGSA